jgi:hypothetical protein
MESHALYNIEGQRFFSVFFRGGSRTCSTLSAISSLLCFLLMPAMAWKVRCSRTVKYPNSISF